MHASVVKTTLILPSDIQRSRSFCYNGIVARILIWLKMFRLWYLLADVLFRGKLYLFLRKVRFILPELYSNCSNFIGKISVLFREQKWGEYEWCWACVHDVCDTCSALMCVCHDTLQKKTNKRHMVPNNNSYQHEMTSTTLMAQSTTSLYEEKLKFKIIAFAQGKVLFCRCRSLRLWRMLFVCDNPVANVPKENALFTTTDECDFLYCLNRLLLTLKSIDHLSLSVG